MSLRYDIGIFGGDLRQVYMSAALLSKGYRVATCGLSGDVNRLVYKKQSIDHPSNVKVASLVQEDRLQDDFVSMNYGKLNTLTELFDRCTTLIGPIPMTRDQITINALNAPGDFLISNMASLLKDSHILIGGNIPLSLTEQCDSRNIPYYDLMKDEKITILNAIATAEGTIMEAIKSSDCNLHGSNCLVLGYGRCAKVLTQKLKALDAIVTVAARSDEALAYAEAAGCKTVFLSEMGGILSEFPFIFNTIPALILDKEYLDLVDPQAVIIDISSAPGGIDFKYAESIHLNAKLCLGLPGKYAPKTSSDILTDAILTLIKERSD